MKKLSLLTIVIAALLLLGATPAFAAAKASSEGSIDSEVGIEALQLISGGSSRISDAGNNHINIYGSTKTYKITGIVGMTFYLQYYTGGSWVTLDSFSREGYNTDLYTAMVDYTVSPGYTYRVATEHYAYDGSFKETTWSYTGSLAIK